MMGTLGSVTAAGQAAVPRDMDAKGVHMAIASTSRSAAAASAAAMLAVGAILLLAAPIARAWTPGGVAPARPTGTPSPRVAMALAADPLPYQGGPVMHTNRTHVIFWNPSGVTPATSFDPGYVDLITSFLRDVATDSHKATNVYALSGQYGDATGRAQYDSTFAGVVQATDPIPPPNGSLPCQVPTPADGGPTMPDGITGWTVCVNGDQLAAEVRNVVLTNHLPTGLADVYFVVTPDGIGSCFKAGPDNCSLGGAAHSGFCGFHTSLDQDGTHYLYADMPYTAVPPHCRADNPRPNNSTADPTISVLSHEHSEVVTDPLPNSAPAWQNLDGNENGDLCAGSFGPTLGSTASGAYNQLIGSGRYFTQEEWSNDDAAGSTSPGLGCRAREESNSLTFGSNAPRPPGSPVTFRSGATDPDGSIVGVTWNFGDGSAPATGTSSKHAYRAAGVYQVTMTTTDITGQQDSLAKPITVDTPPAARFSMSALVAGRPARFNGARSSDSDGSVVAYNWSFGDGSKATGVAPRHVFRRGGRFIVRLAVTDNLGLTSVLVRAITVAPLPHVSVSLRGRTLRVKVNEAGTITVGSKHKRVRRAGAVTFRLSGTAGKRKLTIVFRPRVGPTLTKRVTVTLR
jgi:hypothetical protein